MKNCPDQETLSAYVDSELTTAENRAVAIHVDICSRCADNLSSLEALSHAFRALPRPQIGIDLAPQVEVAIRRATRQERLANVWRFAPLSLAAAATIVLGVFIGTALATTPMTTPGNEPMAMFDPIPPGGICLDPDTCYRRNNI